METILCAAVGTASCQHKLEACTFVGRSLLPATLKMQEVGSSDVITVYSNKYQNSALFIVTVIVP